MTLKNLYLLWISSFSAACVVAGLYVLLRLHNLSPDPTGENDFAGLPFVIYAHSVVVFGTGLFLASLVHFWPIDKATNRQLARVIFTIHAAGALLALTLFHYAWIYFMNPLAFALFASFPYISWRVTHRKENGKGLKLFGAFIVGWILLQTWNWYKVFTFKP